MVALCHPLISFGHPNSWQDEPKEADAVACMVGQVLVLMILYMSP